MYCKSLVRAGNEISGIGYFQAKTQNCLISPIGDGSGKEKVIFVWVLTCRIWVCRVLKKVSFGWVISGLGIL